MSRPKAYSPVEGQKYQILVWDNYNREYDHLDYAEDKDELNHMMKNYREIYQRGQRFKVETLPQKYWKNAKKAN